MPDVSHGTDPLLRRQTALAAFGDVALRSEDLGAVLAEACRLVGETLGAGRARVLEGEPDGEGSLVRAEAGWEAGVVALATAPILLPGGRSYGLLQVGDTEPRAVGKDDLEFLRTFCALLGPVIDRLLIKAVPRETEERQVFRLRLSDALQALDDPVEIEGEATRLLREHLGGGWCYYIEWDDAGIVGTVLRDSARGGLPSMVGLHDGSDIPDVMALMRAGRLLDVPDFAAFPLFSPGIVERYTSIGMRSLLSPSLVKNGRLIATLSVADTVPRTWSDDDVALVTEVAERTWAAVGRARAEAALRDSEERLRAIVETATDYAIFTMDPEGRIETWTAGAEAVFGWSGEEMAGQSVDLTFTPEDRAAEAPARERQEALDTGQAPNVRWHLRRDGSRVFIDGIVRPLHGPDGRLRGFVKVGQDVTERQATAERLRESEERFRSFAEASSDVLWIVDADTRRLEYLSPAYERIWGEGRDAILADLGHWRMTVLPEDLPEAEGTLGRAIEGQRSIVEYRIRRPDGALRHIHDTGFPIRGEDGRVRRAGGIAQDLTARRRAELARESSERRLRTLMEGIPQLVWRSQDRGEWTWSSPQWQAFTGQSQAQSRGQGWLDAIHPEDHEPTRRAWEAALAQDQLDVEHRIRRAGDGTYLWHHARSTPVRDESGRLIEWLGTSTDVQALKEMQERQEVMVHELQHRTRNLITVVGSVARQTMARTGPTEAFREAFSHRLEALARVQGLLSRAEQEPITLRALVRLELDALGAAEGERVRLAGPPVRIRSSVVQTLALALHELATNARKYGALSDQGGHLGVEWQVRTENTERRLHIEWCEAFPPRSTDLLSAGRGGGYGRQLIERALPYALDARTTYDLGPAGLRCTIDLPLDRPAQPGSL